MPPPDMPSYERVDYELALFKANMEEIRQHRAFASELIHQDCGQIDQVLEGKTPDKRELSQRQLKSDGASIVPRLTDRVFPLRSLDNTIKDKATNVASDDNTIHVATGKANEGPSKAATARAPKKPRVAKVNGSDPPKKRGRPRNFSRIVNVILRLEDRQVQEFMEIYVCEYSGWDKWQKEVGKIPLEALQEHAGEKGQTVDELLEEYRPRHYTEKITSEDREMGAIFLLDFPTLARQFEALEDMRGFLLMDIEWNYIQDAIDKQRIPIPIVLSGIVGRDDTLDDTEHRDESETGGIGNTATVGRGEYLVNFDIPQRVPDTRSFSPLTGSQLPQMNPPQTHHEFESNGSFGSAAANDTLSPSFGQSTPPPTPSSRLRDMLDEKYREFLEEEKKLENESSSEDDGEGIGNMVVPEPEKDDEEYCPNTKRSSKRTRKMTLKKKESDKMMAQKKKKIGRTRKQKKLQEDSEAEKDSNNAFEAIRNTPKTPTKRKKGVTAGGTDPPSSGRIKLIVRSSRNDTPTKPKGQRSTDIMPSEDPTANSAVSASHAISAKHAIYAAMSTSAHFAQTAVRRSGQNNETEIARVLRNQIQPNELRAAFENIRSEGVQYTERASFAWRAEKADCAGIAFEANDANEVLTGEGKDNA
ncbi:hypothetical protein LB507_004014 [Fusarium sp. FIESC RH6]|nr:hypothetical protein LB507_004014 [Fusarium sp. FIESC RH6]